jgi:asparagine synthase (glutamine-hydrolysing)
VAEHLGARHQERTVRMDALAVLPELVRCYDEPFGDSSAIPTYYLAREAARDVKACLSGDGGDESFAGYDRYPRQLELRRLDRWPRSLRRFASGMATRVLPEHVPGYGLLSQLGDTPLERYQRQVGCFDGSSRERLLLPAWHEALAPNGSFFERDWAEESDPLAQMQRLDLATYLPDDILTKVDRASMAHSLEVRVPLVDHRVVEAAAALPSSLKLRGREKKWILRRVARDLLPPGVVDRPKRGFEVLLVEWLRGPLGEHAQRVLLGARARERGILACDAVERLLRLHGRGGRDFSPRIYSLLFLEEWCRVHLDGAAP